MHNPSLKVPEAVTFEQAIALTQSLLSQVAAGELTEPEIAAVIADLVKTENGARGFFVTDLISETSVADRPSSEVIQALRASPEVVELLVKNLAMSAAQAVFHHRNQKEDLAEGSERVNQRTAQLIKLVDLPVVYERLQQLLNTAAIGEGPYKAFLERWGYDAEQRQAICQVLQQALASRNN